MTDPKGRETPAQDKAALDALSRKLEAVNARHKPDVEPTQTNASNMAEGLKYASEFSAAVLVGAALGWVVDHFTGISPFGLLGGLFLGLCAGIMNVVRAAREGMDGSGEDLPPQLDEDDD
jgi:ATP synthase protein I